MPITAYAMRFVENGKEFSEIGMPFKVAVKLQQNKRDVYLQFYRDGDKPSIDDAFLTFSLRKPGEFTATPNNWLDLLDMVKGTARKLFFKDSNGDVGSAKTLVWREAYLNLYIATTHSDDTIALYFADDAYPEMITRKVPNVIFIDRPDEDSADPKVEYTARRLILSTKLGDGFKKYSAAFRTHFSNELVLFNWLTRDRELSFTPSMFLSPLGGLDVRLLRVCNTFGFEYFQTYDKQYSFTTQRDPVLRAINAVFEKIRSVGTDANDIALRMRTFTDQLSTLIVSDSNTVMDSHGGKLINKNAIIMRLCLNLLDV